MNAKHLAEFLGRNFPFHHHPKGGSKCAANRLHRSLRDLGIDRAFIAQRIGASYNNM